MTTLQTPLGVVATATASATLAAGRHTPVDATAGPLTMTLPTPATIGARLRVEKVDASANTVTVSGTIRGTTNATISLVWQYESVELVAESLSSWRPSAGHKTKGGLDATYTALSHFAPALISDKASYQAWPVIAQCPNGTLVCAYATGAAQHQAEDDTRYVVSVSSTDNGETWSAPVTVYSNVGTTDASTYGIGVNANGDVLVWVRKVTAGVYSNVLYRSTDQGATWALYSSPTLNPQPVLVEPIVAVGSTLLAPYHSSSESGAASRTFGHLKSTDGGATWTQVQLGTAADDAHFPIEQRYYVAADGQRILCLGRNLTAGSPIWQYTSSDGGTTWTAPAATNIVDGNNTPTAIVGTDDQLAIYYFDRTNGANGTTNGGVLRHRRTTLNSIFANPTNWPASRVVAYGTNLYLDNGYPHSVLLPDRKRIVTVYYSGQYRYPGIFAMASSFGTEVKEMPRPKIPVWRLTPEPAGVMGNTTNDFSFAVTTTMTSPTILAVGALPWDELATQGRLWWRLLAFGQVANAGEVLTVSAHWYKDAGNRQDPSNMAITLTGTGRGLADTGWQQMPNLFGYLDNLNQAARFRVEMRAKLSAGAAGSARVYTDTVLMVAVSGATY